MIQPLSGLLAAIDPFLLEPLASPAARRKVTELASQLPAVWTQSCLECRLTPDDERIDLLLCSSRAEGGQRAMAAHLRAEPTSPLLGRTRPFLDAWASPDSRIGQSMPSIWLEYDIPREGEPAPFAFMTLDPGYLGEPDAEASSAPGLPPEKARALAREGLELLLGETPDHASLDTFERCARLLPEGGYMLHMAIMPQRGRRDLRVSAAVPSPQVRAWLEAIGWPGDRRALSLVLALLGPSWGRPSVHFEISSEAVRPTVAFDFYLRSRPDETPEWGRLLDRLVDLGTCDRAKGEAALAWMGEQTADIPGADWTMQINRQLFFKLRVQPDGSIETKAYLAILSTYTLF